MSIATQEKIADFVQNVKQMATEAVDKVCVAQALQDLGVTL